jgi:hypothetical protein
MIFLKRVILAVAAICCCALAGCLEWTQDPQGNLHSIGLPFLPIWTAKDPPAPPTPGEMGISPDEAVKIGGPVLVWPPIPPVTAYRYRYYQTGHNNCQNDLQKMLADRVASNANGPAPYCTENPPEPIVQGSALLF